MDLIGIVSSALCGALAALIAYPLLGKDKQRKVPYLVVFLVLMFGLRAVADRTVVLKLRIAQADRQLKQLPFYKELSEDDPDTYAKIQGVIEDSITRNEGSDALGGKISPLVAASLPKFAARGSDESVVGFVTVVNDQLTTLHKSDPDSCYGFLFPDAPRTSAPAGMSEDDQMKLLTQMGKVIHTAVRSPQAPPDVAHAQQLLAPVQAKLQQDFGKDLELVGHKVSTPRERERVCAITNELYTGVLALPRNDAGLVLRYMLGGA